MSYFPSHFSSLLVASSRCKLATIWIQSMYYMRKFYFAVPSAKDEEIVEYISSTTLSVIQFRLWLFTSSIYPVKVVC